jgi:hypothetical protein
VSSFKESAYARRVFISLDGASRLGVTKEQELANFLAILYNTQISEFATPASNKRRRCWAVWAMLVVGLAGSLLLVACWLVGP